MILKLHFDNYKSFNGGSTLSAIATPASAESSHAVAVQDIPVLKNLAVFGPNSSGKTNLVSALSFLQRLLEKQEGFWDSRRLGSYCRLHKENAKRETHFTIHFSVEATIFAYEISLCISEAKLTEEKLWMRKSSKEDFLELFARESDGTIALGAYLMKHVGSIGKNKLKVYQADYLKNKNVPFLAFLSKNRNHDGSPLLEDIQNAYEYLTRKIVLVSPDETLGTPRWQIQDGQISDVDGILGCFDLGISQIKVKEVGKQEVLEHLPEEILDEFIGIMMDMRKRPDCPPVLKATCSSRTQFVFLEMAEDCSIAYKMIKLEHNLSDSLYDYEEESDGTRRIFQLLNMLLDNNSDKVYVVDELDRSLHSSLVAAFVKKFHDSTKDCCKQFIFTTHDIHLLDDRDLLMHDEIYFVDKDGRNSSQICSLADFRAEKIPSISKAYMQGRFGAIPTIDC